MVSKVTIGFACDWSNDHKFNQMIILKDSSLFNGHLEKLSMLRQTHERPQYSLFTFTSDHQRTYDDNSPN
jgi:hypothetical protein